MRFIHRDKKKRYIEPYPHGYTKEDYPDGYYDIYTCDDTYEMWSDDFFHTFDQNNPVKRPKKVNFIIPKDNKKDKFFKWYQNRRRVVSSVFSKQRFQNQPLYITNNTKQILMLSKIYNAIRSAAQTKGSVVVMSDQNVGILTHCQGGSYYKFGKKYLYFKLNAEDLEDYRFQTMGRWLVDFFQFNFSINLKKRKFSFDSLINRYLDRKDMENTDITKQNILDIYREKLLRRRKNNISFVFLNMTSVRKMNILLEEFKNRNIPVGAVVYREDLNYIDLHKITYPIIKTNKTSRYYDLQLVKFFKAIIGDSSQLSPTFKIVKGSKYNKFNSVEKKKVVMKYFDYAWEPWDWVKPVWKRWKKRKRKLVIKR